MKKLCLSLGHVWLIALLYLLPSPAHAQHNHSFLTDSVEIITDHWGVPHIYAQNESDLFFAQGYYACLDRAFQFEMWRRQATGTVAEILGSREIKRDHGTRLFMFRGDIDQEMNHYHPRGKLIIESYVAGVNACIDYLLADDSRLPVEFHLLNIRPQHWTPAVVISRHQGLLGNIGQELDIGRAVSLLGEAKVKELQWFHPFEPELKMSDLVDSAGLFEPILELYEAYRRSVKFVSGDMGYQDAETDHYEDPFWDDLNSLGSNNWVISGEHTQSGYPIMANDPHRSVTVPSLRYMSHLVAPGWDVIGGGEPEIPGISIGHNGVGTWGLTVYRTDAEDLYVYQLNPENNNQYRHKDRWHDFEIITDTITVKDQGPEVVELRYSVHGPVLLRDEARNLGYAMRCGWLEVGGSPYLASLRMNQSQNFAEFREACNYSHIPGENMIWADRAGNIGWQAVGIAPIRNGFSGMVPLPGDGTHEWDGYLEIKQKPNVLNPPSGVFITANENVTPLDYPHPEAVGYSWSDPVRGDRLAELLESGHKMTMVDMMEIQTDYLSVPARNLVLLIKNILIGDENIQSARKLLLDWDKKLEVNSVEAAIYVEWETVLREKIYELKVPVKARPYIRSLQYKRFFDFLLSPDGDFGKNPLEGRNKLLISCLDESLKNLESRLGADWSSWQYGQPKNKHVALHHALGHLAPDSLRQQMNLGPLSRGGYGVTVGSTGNNLNQSSGATFKILVDTEDWDRTQATNSPGQSGDPASPFYDNLFEIWAKDQYFPLFYSRSKVESVAAKRMVLRP